MVDLSPIPPSICKDDVITFLKERYAIQASEVSDLGSYVDQNLLVVDHAGNKSVLKIHDGAEKIPVIQLQLDVADQFSKALPEIAFPDSLPSSNGKFIEEILLPSGQRHFIRLIKFVPGRMLKDFNGFDKSLLTNIGKVVATTDIAMSQFYDPCASRPDLPWDLKNARKVGHLTKYISCPHKRRLTDFFFMKFENEVEDTLLDTRKSVIHGDLHRYSMMVDDDANCVTGIIDFGDVIYTHTICNLAVCLSDIMIGSEDPITVATKVVGAYHRVNPLTEQEVSILHYLTCTRLAVYIAMAAHSSTIHESNQHAQLKETQVYALMKQMIAINPIHVENVYRQACNFSSLLPEYQRQAEDNLKKRHNMFANMLYTHYAEPLHLTGGGLQYLYDNQGHTYFDCVNNVSQWGHSNPHIVKPAQKQISRLNTNSRYVYGLMTDYAEQLLATLPEELDVVFFCNSGSEANDLAMRIARTVTGQNDMIVIDTAYHGHTSSCTEISPNRIDRPGKPGLPEHIHKVPAPDTYRGMYLSGEAQIGEKYAAEIIPILDRLKNTGKGPAAFIAESLVGTGGQFVLPDNYLDNIYKHVRESGGLCIADEVQVGFARTGENFWCFQSQNVVPDIVTFGKPMGNGHPMAALVTTKSIADKFDNGVTFFNTFSANPVSCAFGKAVLDVLENDQLQANTVKQAKVLFDGLKRLKEKYPFVGDVRGKGLYIGVELVTCRETKQPATELAKVIVEEMKNRFILINTNGYDNNIIKIKPPLIIEESDVNRLISTLDEVFQLVSV